MLVENDENDLYEVDADALALAINSGLFVTTLDILHLAAELSSKDHLITRRHVEEAIAVLKSHTPNPPDLN